MAIHYVTHTGSDTYANATSFSTPCSLATAVAGYAAGDEVRICATGTYTLSSTNTFTTNGDTTTGRVVFTGANSSGTVDGTRPTITSATNSVHLFTLSGCDYIDFVYLNLTHTAATRGDGFRNTTSDSLNIRIRNCIIDGCQIGVDEQFSMNNLDVENTEIKNCISHGISGGSNPIVVGCDIHDNGGKGWNIFTGGNGLVLERCNIAANAGGGLYSTSNGGYASRFTISDNNFRGQTGDGINIAETSATFTLILRSNKFYGNSGYGINLACTTVIGDSRTQLNVNNAYGSNTSGSANHLSAGTGDVTLSADPDTSSSNFNLNNTAGGGSACRAAAFPGAFTGGRGTSYGDIGAAQHQDSASGGGPAVFLWTG